MPAFETRSIHGGIVPDPVTGAILTPIFQSTTFVQDGVGKDRGYTYTRCGNPTVAALERNLGELEGSPLPALAFASGMAAISATLFALLSAGDEVVVSDVVYGGTIRLLRRVLEKFGVRAILADTSRPEALAAAVSRRTRLVLVETPANPTLKLTDVRAAAEIAHSAGARLAVDNTFLTPALQSPFELGADLVVYSTTKYIEGHNATVGGAVLTRDREEYDALRLVQKTIGFAQSPFESWLTLQGVKTLGLRIARHSENALEVARFLEGHPAVASVRYPWLESFPQHDLARRQQKAGGGIVSFEVKGGVEASVRFLEGVRLAKLAENLGAVESLVTHPATMTHASYAPEERRALGISDGLVRLSVGLESVQDLVADLDGALDRAAGRVLVAGGVR